MTEFQTGCGCDPFAHVEHHIQVGFFCVPTEWISDAVLCREKMKIPANVVDQLIAGSQSDIRQVLNMLSTWRLSSDSMTFDEGKELCVLYEFLAALHVDTRCRAKMNEKNTILTPFDVTNKMLGPYMFSHTARETLGDKIELYFHDHSFVPLFIQVGF